MTRATKVNTDHARTCVSCSCLWLLASSTLSASDAAACSVMASTTDSRAALPSLSSAHTVGRVLVLNQSGEGRPLPLGAGQRLFQGSGFKLSKAYAKVQSTHAPDFNIALHQLSLQRLDPALQRRQSGTVLQALHAQLLTQHRSIAGGGSVPSPGWSAMPADTGIASTPGSRPRVRNDAEHALC